MRKNNRVADYHVNSIKDLTNIIIPHFDKYPLITQKRADFELFKQVVEIMIKKEHLTIEGLHRILAIRASMNLGLSDVLKTAFPDITPVARPTVELPKNIEPNWLAGFTEGEGCFNVSILSSKSHKIGYQVIVRFIIAQHSRDVQLMKNLISNFGCGVISENSSQSVVIFTVNKLEDISEIIIPFFNEYPLHGSKRQDFEDFVEIVKLIKGKAHLTIEGLEQIRVIKSGMNRGRFSEA